MTHNLFNTKQTFTTGNGTDGTFYSLPQLEKEGSCKNLETSDFYQNRFGIGASQF